MVLLKVFFFSTVFVAFSSCRHLGYDDSNDDHEPQPYNFGYAVQDLGNAHYRKEKGDGHGGVEGSYGFTDENGIRREVHYVADHNGFRAQIKTNEPGTISGNPADVDFHSSGRQYDEGFHQFRRHF